jgi:dienelactone hydrolase
MARKTLMVFTSASDRAWARASLAEFLAGCEKTVAAELDARIAKLRSPADVRRWQRVVRRHLHEILGPFPERTALRARVVGSTRQDGVTIERVTFESQPDYTVTANVYRAGGGGGRLPAVLLSCGHSANGKATTSYQTAAMALALQGYVVMSFDPTGQGERSECIDPQSGREFVHREVPQHHYTGKPTFLTGMTLAGYRVWDGIRALDYLCGRADVDVNRIGMLGCSGGGAMTLLVACVDERVKVCAPSHPGGSMENSQLNGRRPPDALIYSLLAPRPCRIIVGRASGEVGHLDKFRLLTPFYRAYGCLERLEFMWVEGKHGLFLPQRMPSYEWLNRWLGMPPPGPAEPSFQTVSERRLNCTRTGRVQTSLPGQQTMQRLNAARAKRLAPVRELPAAIPALKAQQVKLRRAVKRRMALRPCTTSPRWESRWISRERDGYIEGGCFESEPGISIPALRMIPSGLYPRAAVMLHVAADGKPLAREPMGLPIRLMKLGHPVFSIDVRDVGELSAGPILDDLKWPPGSRNPLDFNERRWAHDLLALRALGVGATLTGMRTFDVMRAAALIRADAALAGRAVIVVGEQEAGVWALAAAALDPRLAGAVTVRTLVSYRMLTDNARYRQFNYFWLPGVLSEWDLPDLPALIAPRPVLALDPVDQMCRRMEPATVSRYLAYASGAYGQFGVGSEFKVLKTAGNPASIARAVHAVMAKS